MNAFLKTYLAIIASTLPATINAECMDNAAFTFTTETGIEQDCSWIQKKVERAKRYCVSSHPFYNPNVYKNCPLACSAAPSVTYTDTDGHEFPLIYNGEMRPCAWITYNPDHTAKRMDKYCTFDQQMMYCPATCGCVDAVDDTPTMEPSKNPTMSPSELRCTDLPETYEFEAAGGGEGPYTCGWLTQHNNEDVNQRRKDLYCTEELQLYACAETCGLCTKEPSSVPTSTPSTPSPTASPTLTVQPSSEPSRPPSPMPSPFPTILPTGFPSDSPSLIPSNAPSDSPSKIPSDVPSDQPSSEPSRPPSPLPSPFPTWTPTAFPSDSPSMLPSVLPSDSPTNSPTRSIKPSPLPSVAPISPSGGPSQSPSTSSSPSSRPTSSPSSRPTLSPSSGPSIQPTNSPTRSIKPSPIPTNTPSFTPSKFPSNAPSHIPTPSCYDDKEYEFNRTPDKTDATMVDCTYMCKNPNLEKTNKRQAKWCNGEVLEKCCASCSAGPSCSS